jgi:hypothetical protein
VNGILLDSEDSSFFVMGILNSRVVDFVFRRISKPKERRPSGAYFEANKQYIAPLPIPVVGKQDKERVATMARELQAMHTARRDTIGALDQRLASSQLVSARREPSWLWADVGDIPHWTARNKDGLKGRALAAWAKQACEEKLAVHLAEISSAMSFGAHMSATARDGELKFFVRDRCVVAGIYVSEREAPLLLAQWRQKARDTFVSDAVTAARLVEWLLDLKSTGNAALVAQIDALNRKLDTLEDQIRRTERTLDDLIYRLFKLSEEERIMVEADTRPRWEARMPSPPE